MNQHPYLRAYMAGIVLPTALLLVALTAFVIARGIYSVPVPIERWIIFPMALVPNLWGVWNMLYIALPPRWRLPLGLHGVILPVPLLPLGLLLAQHFMGTPPPGLLAKAMPLRILILVVFYYLAWKYPVKFLNKVQGIA
jgi:hypothetical protein